MWGAKAWGKGERGSECRGSAGSKYFVAGRPASASPGSEPSQHVFTQVQSSSLTDMSPRRWTALPHLDAIRSRSSAGSQLSADSSEVLLHRPRLPPTAGLPDTTFVLPNRYDSRLVPSPMDHAPQLRGPLMAPSYHSPSTFDVPQAAFILEDSPGFGAAAKDIRGVLGDGGRELLTSPLPKLRSRSSGNTSQTGPNASRLLHQGLSRPITPGPGLDNSINSSEGHSFDREDLPTLVGRAEVAVRVLKKWLCRTDNQETEDDRSDSLNSDRAAGVDCDVSAGGIEESASSGMRSLTTNNTRSSLSNVYFVADRPASVNPGPPTNNGHNLINVVKRARSVDSFFLRHSYITTPLLPVYLFDYSLSSSSSGSEGDSVSVRSPVEQSTVLCTSEAYEATYCHPAPCSTHAVEGSTTGLVRLY